MPTGTLRIAFAVQPFLAQLKGSAFVRNVLLVMTGTAMAQAIGFGLSPLITRLFSRADLAILGSFDAVANVIGDRGALQYCQALCCCGKTAAIRLRSVECFATGEA